jgi:arginine transport system permease protein
MTGYYLAILIGAKTTILLALFAMLLGMVLAILGACVELSDTPFKYMIMTWNVFMRGMPDILILFACDFMLQELIAYFFHGSSASPFLSGVISLAIIVGAYATQILIAAFKTINYGHLLTAKSLNIVKYKILYYIIIPQVIKHSLPALVNLSLVIIKDSSLVSLIGLNEMMNAAHIASSESFEPFNYYGFAALIYLIMSWVVIKLQKYIKNILSLGEDNVVDIY